MLHFKPRFRAFQTFALIAAAVILSINIYFIVDYVAAALGTSWYVYAAMALPTILYIGFILYLVRFCPHSENEILRTLVEVIHPFL